MITSKKMHTLSLDTFASFIAINRKRKPFGGEDRTEQGCMIHLTANEAQQLGEAVPEIDFNKLIKTHNELQYIELFKGQAPSGYLHNGLIRTMNVKRTGHSIPLTGHRSGEAITEDPMYRTAARVTLEVYEYHWRDQNGTSVRLSEIKVLEA